MSDFAAVQVTDLHKRFRGGWFGNHVDALRGVSFDVPQGQVFGLLGPNGAGKTTLVKILLGIVRSTGGSATLLGRPAGDRGGRQRVGYLPENLRVPAHQTARTAMEYYGRLSGMDYAEIRQRSAQLLDTVGLGKRSKESVKQFSKGMRQRLGLAQSLLHDPDLLILDEPTDGLDPVGRSQVRNILSDLSDQGKTVFINSHLLQEVELVCDRVAILDHGQLRYTGDFQDLHSTAATAELTLELAASPDEVSACLPDRELKELRADPGGCHVAVSTQGQPDVDSIVDALRAARISIRGLAHRKTTLEDFFLDVVAEKVT